MHRIFVKPGEIHWSDQPRLYKTVLGSCVSVCLWDTIRRVGGLNHFVLPHAPAGDNDARFGDVAIPRLIEALDAMGCTDLVAKVFGGAAVLPIGSTGTVGGDNTDVALALLRRHGIPMVAQRTGGAQGIVIQYLCATGDVLVREIPQDGGADRPR